MANFKQQYFLLCLCLLFSRHHGSDNLMNKGGFVFERVVTSNLNQEFMSFTRQLDIELLNPLVSNLKGLINIHNEICTKAQQQIEGKIDKSVLLPSQQYYVTDNTAIFTPTYGLMKESADICAKFNSDLPEYTLSTAEAIESICRQISLTHIPMNMYLNSDTKRIHYKSNDQIIPSTLFPSFYVFDGTHKKYDMKELDTMAPQLANLSIHLTMCNTNKPTLSFIAAQFLPDKLLKIVCEKFHNLHNIAADDLASQFLYQWVSHSCERDHPVMSQHVEHAVIEVNNILNYQIDPKKLLTYAQYFPQLIGQQSPLTANTHISVDLHSNPSSFLQAPEFSVKQKRSANESTIPHIPEHTNLTEISPEQFLEALNITTTEIKSQLSKAYQTDKPSIHDIEKFILDKKLETNTNSTYSVVRHKRHWLVIAGGLTIVAVAFYYLINYILGLFSLDLEDMQNDQPPLATAAQMNIANGHISTLSINQKQIQQAVKEGETTINKLQKQFASQTFAIAVWAAQLDVKNNIQMSLQILSDFILKLASILLGVQSGKTSPFALNIKELAELQIRTAQKYAGVILTNKLSEIKTTRVDTDKALTLQFTIPISSPETEYVFYKVIPIPIFENNQTYIPSSPFTNLAMAKQNHYYTTLSSEEFATCMGSPSICNTHYPMKYISTNFDCILTSFLNNQLTCPIIKTETVPYPFLYFNDLEAIYSVPSQTRIRTTCISPEGKRTDQVQDLAGTGSITFQPNCKITTTGSPYEFHYNTPKVSVSQNIAHWHTFENIKFNIIPDTNVIVTPQMIHNSSSNLNLTEVNVQTWEELLKDSFQPKSSLKTIFQLLLYIVPIIIIIYLIKFLNNTATCTAIKGATTNRTSRFYAGKVKWIQKRSTDYKTAQNPPLQSSRFKTFHHSLMSLRPVQAAAMAHQFNPATATLPFTSQHLQSQQKVNNVRFQIDPLYPTRAELEDVYATADPAPPAYAPIIRPNRFNNRSNSTFDLRHPQSSLPPVPDTFEMK
jgi:hypothetical protein